MQIEFAIVLKVRHTYSTVQNSYVFKGGRETDGPPPLSPKI